MVRVFSLLRIEIQGKLLEKMALTRLLLCITYHLCLRHYPLSRRLDYARLTRRPFIAGLKLASFQTAGFPARSGTRYWRLTCSPHWRKPLNCEITKDRIQRSYEHLR